MRRSVWTLETRLAVGVVLTLASIPVTATGAGAQAVTCAPPAATTTVALPGGDAASAAAQPGPAPDAPQPCWTWSMDAYTMNADENDILATGDIVVTVAHDPTVIALGAADGTERWHLAVSNEDYGSVNGLAAADGVVYAGGTDGLTAIEASDGSVRWEYLVDNPDSPNPAWGGFFSPVVIGGAVYGTTRRDAADGTISFQLTALDAATGVVRWAVPVSTEQAGAPVSDGTLVVVEYYTLEDALRWPNLGAFDALTGESRWVAEIRDVEKWPTSRPVVTGDLVYLGDQSGDVVARSAADGSRAWKTNVGANVETLTAVDGTLYATNALAELHALNASTGKKRWHAKAKGDARLAEGTIPAVVLDGPVIIGATDNEGGAWLYAFDPNKGKQLWRTETGPSSSGFTSPVVSGGRVVVGMHDSSADRVVSFGTP